MRQSALENTHTKTLIRNRGYLIYLVAFMGIVALMDWYLSMVEATAKPYILQEFNMSAPVFANWETIYLIPTFFIFLLNGLNDIIGRKYTILILILLMGSSAFAVTQFTPTFHSFMVVYCLINFAVVSNTWTIPVSEEAPAASRAKLLTIVYAISMIPLSAIIPPLIIPLMGWRWAYGITIFIGIVALAMWPFMKETGRYYQIKEDRKLGIKKNHAYGIGVIKRKDIFYIIVSVVIWASWLFVSRAVTWAGYYFMNIHKFSLNEWSLFLGVGGITSILGALAAGWVMDKIGRIKAFYFSCFGLILSLALTGFLPRELLPIAPALVLFFLMFNYAWIVVYIPEIFPTEIRGSCLGWTTTISRGTFVLAPLAMSALLKAFPDMQFFWLITGLFMVIPIVFILFTKPHETMGEELEDIEVRR
jgi:MFS family permease